MRHNDPRLSSPWLARRLGALAFMAAVGGGPAAPPLHAENLCAPCQQLDDLECGVVLNHAIQNCCGYIDGSGYAQCNTGLAPDGYAVACNGGGGCICYEWGDNCSGS
jgi:hypothetical protein